MIADKYDMPALLQQLDHFLQRQLMNAAEAIHWTSAIGNVQLPLFHQACEDCILDKATQRQFDQAAASAFHDSFLHMIIGLQKRMQFSDFGRPATPIHGAFFMPPSPPESDFRSEFSGTIDAALRDKTLRMCYKVLYKGS